jgi:hypothetical protein
MSGRDTLRRVAVILGLAIALPAASQQPRGISTVDPAAPGTAIAVMPDDPGIDPRLLEIPELAGAQQAIGSQLVDGRLPRPLIDYRTESDSVTERLTLFETGLVAVHLAVPGGEIRKKVILPPDAVQAYRKELSPHVLAAMPEFAPEGTAFWRGVIRLYDPAGTPVERKFDSATLLPRELQQFRMVMQDLLRAICQDREVTNSVAGYTPKVGDQLVSDDQRVFEVTSLMGDGKFVELLCTTDPTRIYVATKDLHLRFVGSRRPAQP